MRCPTLFTKPIELLELSKMPIQEKVIHIFQALSSVQLRRAAKERDIPVQVKGFNTLAGRSGLFNIDLLSGFGFVAHGTGSRANEPGSCHARYQL